MRSRHLRYTTVLLIIFLSITLSGCWSRIETDNLAIVTTIALDITDDNKISMGVEIVRPAVITGSSVSEEGGSGGGGQPLVQVNSTGETAYDAWRNLQLKVGRMMFFAHTQQIIAGEKLAREGISPYLDFTEHRFRLRRNIGFAVTPGEAKEVLTATPILETAVGLALNRFNKNYTRQSKTPLSNLGSFYDNLLCGFTDPTASKITVLPPDPKTGQRHLKYSGAAVFKKDKLIGWLSEKETRGLDRILDHMGRGTVSVSSPFTNGEEKISIVSLRSSTQVTSTILDNRPQIKIKVFEEGEIADIESSLDISSTKVMAAIDRAYENAIRDEINAAILAAQQIYGVDILEFGKVVRRQHNTYWNKNRLGENWGDIFPDLLVEVAVEATVKRIGLTLHPH